MRLGLYPSLVGLACLCGAPVATARMVLDHEVGKISAYRMWGLGAYKRGVRRNPTPPGNEGSLVWFDETNGGTGFGSFSALQSAHDEFLGLTEQIVTFEEFPAGTKITDQYNRGDALDKGVEFRSPRNRNYVRPEGGWWVRNLDGYDGTYQPDGSMVLRTYSSGSTPFTILFDEPVVKLGSFLGQRTRGSRGSMTIRLFDENGELIGSRTYQPEVWGDRKNRETFWAVAVGDGPGISRVEIQSRTHQRCGNAMVFDNLRWSVPEVGTYALVLSAAGWIGLIRRRYRLGRR